MGDGGNLEERVKPNNSNYRIDLLDSPQEYSNMFRIEIGQTQYYIHQKHLLEYSTKFKVSDDIYEILQESISEAKSQKRPISEILGEKENSLGLIVAHSIGIRVGMELYMSKTANSKPI